MSMNRMTGRLKNSIIKNVRSTSHLSQMPSCEVSRSILRLNTKSKLLVAGSGNVCSSIRFKSRKTLNVSELVVPIQVKVDANPDDINVGEEISGSKLNRDEIIKKLNEFFRRQPIKKLSEENGLDSKLYNQAFISFRKFCIETSILPPELHIILGDVTKGAGHVDDLFPFFLKHARMIFPHLECMEELKKISDSRLPHNWYPEARSIARKIIFHSGPTNSGKTYNALKAFIEADSGVYCGPLKLLAVEVNKKANDAGTPCDLVTGEEINYAISRETPAKHTACTVEMASINKFCDVAIIDEIQMMRDPQRGWAWTRALLGIPAKELHVCGEEAAVDVVKNILSNCGEDVEVRRYNRLTKLIVESSNMGTLSNVKPGDCIVCFNKSDIYTAALQLEKMGHEVAVIYGSLPPATKLAQAARFNDPKDKCKILVSTDAIGMGLNLSIRRIIFNSITKLTQNEAGDRVSGIISVSTALQIAGRAGRYGTQFSEGRVTTYRKEDLPILTGLLQQKVDPIEAAGIHPTADQLEMFAYHLPHATLANLIDIFVSLCQVETENFFLCHVEDIKFFADMIQHVELPLRARYVFCCAPINKNYPFVCSLFLKFARMYSQNEPITHDWLCRNIGWPLKKPEKIQDLMHLEQVFDVLDLYLWLSYRFTDLFSEQELVRDMQRELDSIIQKGVVTIVKLLKEAADPVTGQINIYSNTNGYYASPQNGEKTINIESVVNDRDDDSSDDYQSEQQASKSNSRKSDSRKEFLLSSSESSKIATDNRMSLTNQLISSGLLTQKMMEKLQKEWLLYGKKEDSRDGDERKSSKNVRSIRKTSKTTKKS